MWPNCALPLSGRISSSGVTAAMKLVAFWSLTSICSWVQGPCSLVFAISAQQSIAWLCVQPTALNYAWQWVVSFQKSCNFQLLNLLWRKKKNERSFLTIFIFIGYILFEVDEGNKLIWRSIKEKRPLCYATYTSSVGTEWILLPSWASSVGAGTKWSAPLGRLALGLWHLAPCWTPCLLHLWCMKGNLWWTLLEMSYVIGHILRKMSSVAARVLSDHWYALCRRRVCSDHQAHPWDCCAHL